MIIEPDTVETYDVGIVSRKMAALVKKNLADPSMADWLLAEFTTTEENDLSVEAMMLLGL